MVEGGGKTEEKLEQLAQRLEDDVHAIESLYKDKIAKLTKGDELPPGVIKMVKVYVAIKRKLSVGDKMAGRHGNKGVVSRILPEEDMPYLEDGTPVDIVLNPLGVPSRMNVGQILECHLGGAARAARPADRRLPAHATTTPRCSRRSSRRSTPPSRRTRSSMRSTRATWSASPTSSAAASTWRRRCSTAPRKTRSRRRSPWRACATDGQRTLFDGKTGDAFEHDVTVGVMYMLKLHHLVDDKIHARSIGPYSLVTQQPLGGKAQFGGQRLGEMEVWAMEAYGAAYGLQEFLTVKSDDVVGRTRMYEAIVKGEHTLESGLPESFNVLLKELQSLCLNVELIEDPNAPRQQQEPISTVQQMAREAAAKIGA